MAVYRLILYLGLAASNKVIAEPKMNQDGELKSPATVMSCSGTPSPDNDLCRDIDGKRVIVS